MHFWVTTDRNSWNAWKVLSWSVSLSVLLRQVSMMRCGACEESTGSLFTEIFLKVRRNRKSGNPATRVLQLSRSVLSNVWTESASGLPRHQYWFYTNSSSAFKLLTTDPLPQPDTRTHTSCLASLRASSLNFDLIMPATNLALYQLKWNLHILSVRMFYFCALTFASVMTEVLVRIVRTT